MKTTSSLLVSVAAFAGLSSAAVLPTVADLDTRQVGAPVLPPPTVLKPIRRPNRPASQIGNLVARQTAGQDVPVVLKPISRARVAESNAAFKIKSRQDAIAPTKEIFLGYGSADMTALVDAAMKQPAVVLEEVAGISSVSCTDTEVSLSFADDASLQAASGAWPTSDFIIITYSPEGGCNTADERGFYAVSGITFDEAGKSAKVVGARSALEDQTDEANVEFDGAADPAAAKRDLKASFGAELSGTIVDTSSLKIAVDQAKFESNIRLKGGFRFNFLKFKPSKMYLDLDYSGLINLNVSTHVEASFSTNVFNYEPLSASISAFTIPGILDVGPIAQFAIGVEFAASGTLDATLGLTSEIEAGNVHLDLLNNDKSSSSGWTPKTTVASDLSAEVSLQLNPYADLNLALGVRVFKGAIDLTSGVEVKPQIINAFSADLNFAFTSQSGITFTQPEGATCPTGAWFASTFNMDVNAYIGSLYSKTLFNVNAPIFQSQCWNFVN